ncbi:hypothetical protein DY000_02001571 [Brassica cretica]|uniref:K-box domain-containing protein n=1 Tax=Brassica cretica TaxID=69181 RepID=A0ABQ7C255_BRACR|nr:hypothetical protein DY000_02001571 [Brassica cretica]
MHTLLGFVLLRLNARLEKILDRYGKKHADDLNALDLQSKSLNYSSHHELLELVESKLVESIVDVSVDSLVELEDHLETALSVTRARKAELMLKLVESLKEKENLLKEENQVLASQRQHVSSSVLRWASVIKGKGPSSGEMLTLDCDLWRSSPPHRRDVSGTFRIETVQPLLPLIDLKSGKCSSAVEARLLRFWEAKNVKRGGELMWFDLLLIDVNSTMMQATIYANRLSRFRSKLAAGTMFTISGFDVTRCAQNFRLTDSPLMIRFNDSTAFDELTKPVSPLPEEGFRFRDHSQPKRYAINIILILSLAERLCNNHA